MGWCVSLQPEVLLRGHDAVSETLHPQAIHGDARDERILRVRHPLREAEPVLWRFWIERHHRCGRRGLHRTLEVRRGVVTARQDVKLPGMRRIFHDHDQRDLVKIVVLQILACGNDGLSRICCVLVHTSEPMFTHRSLRRCVAGLCGFERSLHRRSVQICHFQRRQRQPENFQLINQAIREPSVVARSCTEAHDLGLDALVQMIVPHRRCHGLAVVVEFEPCCGRRAVVSHGDIHPFAHWKILLGLDRCRTSRPQMDTAPAQLSILQQKLESRRVRHLRKHRRAGMENQRALLSLRRKKPQRHAQWLMPGDSLHAIELQHRIAVELHRARHHARHRGELATGHRRSRRARRRVRQLSVHDCVERKMVRGHRRRERRSGSEPFLERRVAPGQHGFLRRDGRRELRPAFLNFRGVLWFNQPHRRLRRSRGKRVRIQPALINLPEHRGHAVVVGLRQRVVFVVVAFAAFHRQPEKGSARRVDAVRDILLAKLLLDRAAFLRLPVQPIERSRQRLLRRCIGQEVTCGLPRHELVVGEIFVKRTNHPIAPRPHEASVVRLIPIRVRKPCDIHPILRHPLAVARRSEQRVHLLLV